MKVLIEKELLEQILNFILIVGLMDNDVETPEYKELVKKIEQKLK